MLHLRRVSCPHPNQSRAEANVFKPSHHLLSHLKLGLSTCSPRRCLPHLLKCSLQLGLHLGRARALGHQLLLQYGRDAHTTATLRADCGRAGPLRCSGCLLLMGHGGGDRFSHGVGIDKRLPANRLRHPRRMQVRVRVHLTRVAAGVSHLDTSLLERSFHLRVLFSAKVLRDALVAWGPLEPGHLIELLLWRLPSARLGLAAALPALVHLL
mmetsp:Transcript_286/g.817  ORF Transcript_286/g.817 Transcript_286/m.817 type:complete len:211 (+) Transcript_286:824-1456(+)